MGDGPGPRLAAVAVGEVPFHQLLSRLLRRWCLQERAEPVGAAGRHCPTRHGSEGLLATEPQLWGGEGRLPLTGAARNTRSYGQFGLGRWEALCRTTRCGCFWWVGWADLLVDLFLAGVVEVQA